MNVLQFMADQRFCGEEFAGESWETWRAALAGAFAITPPDDAAQAWAQRFAELAGGRAPPQKRVRELWVVAGRRSAKTQVAGAVAVWLATVGAKLMDVQDRLARGERAVVALIAVDRHQAAVALRYIEGVIDGSAILSGMVTRQTADSIELNNRTTIQVLTNSFRAIRGRTLLAVLLDEVAFFHSADDRQHTDREVYRAALPGLATLDGMVIGVSSPYARKGLLFEKHRKHYGEDSDDVLVLQGSTRDFNPVLDQRVIDAAFEDDPQAARAEFGGLFRDDIAAYIDRELLDRLTRDEPLELPYDRQHRYFAFCDPAGGGKDEYGLAIGHVEDGAVIIDLVRGERGVPAEITAAYSALLHSYGIGVVESDRYGGSWPKDAFLKHNITLRHADRSKSELFIEALPRMRNGLVQLPPDRKAINQFASLERRTSRGTGRDVIDHPRGGSDDRANAIAGCIVTATQKQFVRDLSALGTLGIGAPLPYRSRRRTSSW